MTGTTATKCSWGKRLRKRTVFKLKGKKRQRKKDERLCVHNACLSSRCTCNVTVSVLATTCTFLFFISLTLLLCHWLHTKHPRRTWRLPFIVPRQYSLLSSRAAWIGTSGSKRPVALQLQATFWFFFSIVVNKSDQQVGVGGPIYCLTLTWGKGVSAVMSRFQIAK